MALVFCAREFTSHLISKTPPGGTGAEVRGAAGVSGRFCRPALVIQSHTTQVFAR